MFKTNFFSFHFLLGCEKGSSYYYFLEGIGYREKLAMPGMSSCFASFNMDYSIQGDMLSSGSKKKVEKKICLQTRVTLF